MEGMTFIYEQKEGAPTSFYLKEGNKGILPGRISINRFPVAETSKKHRKKAVGQFKGTFKKSETSAYKIGNGTLHSNIYSPHDQTTSAIIGIGDIKGTNDLLIFEELSKGTLMRIGIHIFPGEKFHVAEKLKALTAK